MSKPADQTLPIVACIMPTHNRREFVPYAIRRFLDQDYPRKELVIVDDGSDPVADLIPQDDRIRYLRLGTRAPIGAKRNLACEQAEGSIIAHWDDDDWHARDRLSYQVGALLDAQADVCGLTTLLFYDLRTGQAWQYVYPPGGRVWLAGSSLCYQRGFWASHHFPEIDVGEDARFVRNGQPERMLSLSRYDFHVGIIHARNISPKPAGGSYWRPYPASDLLVLLGDDWPVGPRLDLPPAVDKAKAKSHAPRKAKSHPSRVQPSMAIIARQSDLDLPEFAAFNFRQALPRMRRWELPFVLYQAQLTSTMAVLDCTVNPAGFQARLAALYPDVHYRHWSPIQFGRFALPLGFPDEAFDRVFCINTLEHLLRSQRQALVQALARKLKPGGRLVLTSDFYFDSSWSDPAFLNAGVVRADRQEIFSGWNKVTPQEWLELCSSSGLQPLGGPADEPLESDASLYRQLHPFAHACIGGVFVKPPVADSPPGEKIALGLLTWNTKSVSLDSVRAYAREARLLRRLGQVPLMCVCDNGSTDGTPQALRDLEAELDFDYRFIFNPENRGSSIARNQIIDAALDFGAKYLLLMDGDVEVVPFSSFAMLRHMENSGSLLGSVGADMSGYTRARGTVTPYQYSLDELRKETNNQIACTQYGMFRCSIFRDGVLFDEAAPFDCPGWGFEDNDLAFQMEVKGYLAQRFFGMTFLHRAPHSSIRILQSQGIDMNRSFAQRKQYLIDKWSANPTINNGPLETIRRIEMRF